MKKIYFESGDFTFEYESTPREPMPESRFRALCGVAYAAIGAAALLGFFALFVGAVG